MLLERAERYWQVFLAGVKGYGEVRGSTMSNQNQRPVKPRRAMGQAKMGCGVRWLHAEKKWVLCNIAFFIARLLFVSWCARQHKVTLGSVQSTSRTEIQSILFLLFTMHAELCTCGLQRRIFLHIRLLWKMHFVCIEIATCKSVNSGDDNYLGWYSAPA